MTANAFDEDRKKVLSVGMNDHVAKPIDIKKIGNNTDCDFTEILIKQR